MSPARIMAKRKRSEHYVNNKEFLAALIKLREDREIAEIQGKEKPRIPRYMENASLRLLLIYLSNQTLLTTCLRKI